MGQAVEIERAGRVVVVALNRPEKRNAVDLAASLSLYDAFKQFDADENADIAVLTGRGGTFCAGADLSALTAGEHRPVEPDGDFAPMGPTRLRLSKPVIAAVEGPAVGGGLELALWCDLRVAAASAVFGVFNRRFGVPLVDLGTIRLPRLIGQGRALDLILTGRPVGAEEAQRIGLVDRLVPDGRALEAAVLLATQIAMFPQTALRNDRLSVLEQWNLGETEAVKNEVARGLATIASGETARGAAAFARGSGRHGAFGESKAR
jgi:enoyl-CoA hydratase